MNEPRIQTRSTIESTVELAEPVARANATFHHYWARLASLRLTVALFAFSIVLIFAGTLAQVEKDIWQVIDEYFRTLIAWIEFKIFFPPSFFPNPPRISGGVYFPGGWLLGSLMMVNLLAAHTMRFKVQAKGKRKLVGVLTIVFGLLLTTFIVVAGATHDGLSQTGWISWLAVWRILQISLAAVAGLALYAILRLDSARVTERRLLWTVATLSAVGLIWTLAQGEAGRLSDSSLRIVWQLGKGGLAGLVLLSGCALVFGHRAGIVLLHAGIGLLMFGELLVGLTATESRTHVREGETVNYVYDIHNLELAIIDKSEPGFHHVVSVPESRLRNSRMVRHPHLPFDLQVVQFIDNAQLQFADPQAFNPATAGVGQQWIARPLPQVSGIDPNGGVNQPAAYLRLLDKNDADDLGTRLVSLTLTSAELPDTVEVDGKNYHLYLRYKRTYKPYSLTLVDVRKDDYPGTDTPRNYSSDVRLVDGERQVDRETRIWMNNPLRFAGETFYQTGYFRDPETGHESSTLSIVRNTSWMLPYVACMLVATGLLAHFGTTLFRFLRRRTDRSRSVMGAGVDTAKTNASAPWVSWAVPLLIVMIMAGWLASKARTPVASVDQPQLYEFGKLPVVYQGRVKPIDTLARNSLAIISNRQTFVDDSGSTRPATEWLLDLIARRDRSDSYRVFRIEHPEVLDMLALQRRKGLRYSFSELEPRIPELRKQAQIARSMDPADLSVYQKKVVQLENRLELHDLLIRSFGTPLDEATDQRGEIDFTQLLQQQQQLSRRMPPLCIPPIDPAGEWQTYCMASTQLRIDASAETVNASAVQTLGSIFEAWTTDDALRFNNALAEYRSLMGGKLTGDLNLAKLNFEAFFNHFAPFYCASALYVIAFVLVALSWLGWNTTLNRAAFWLTWLTLGLHTFALVARIYISGRPPVTNLYSSAVFIGWGCVVLGIVLERMYRVGIGNVICTVSGFSTLLIAHFLAGDGDTFAVLQAVLDTQFWLATHVVCITLGYTTTFVAGLLGIIYIIRGVLTPGLSPETREQLSRMIYGTICFATLFSFVGTVLGGLWADDSWGRFWGWDPKENGALIIVLWNALVLHARWGGMIRKRGLAVLAVAGNIAVAWSWFGVNELGVGLHSYGFTEGVLPALGLFVLSQLSVMALAWIPERRWWSFRKTGN